MDYWTSVCGTGTHRITQHMGLYDEQTVAASKILFFIRYYFCVEQLQPVKDIWIL